MAGDRRRTCSVRVLLVAEQLLESSSESDYDDENDFLTYILKYYRRSGIRRRRIENYVENVVPLYSEREFKSHFRMRPDTFEYLLDLLRPQLKRQSAKSGRFPISPEKQLLIAIWMLATPDSFRSVSIKFDVGNATAWRALYRVTKALYSHVARFIKWPTRDEAERTWIKLNLSYGFPKAIGAIDGTHIKICAPKDHPESYVNRKGIHSIQLQVVCNADMEFIHCYAGQAGSVHDMRIFRLSGFQDMCIDEKFPENSHLLGDAAYSIQKHIMVPYKDNGHLQEDQVNFNRTLSSARMVIERSFALLKGRFRCLLDILPMRRTDFRYIIACCILHNICIQRGDLIDIPVIVEPVFENGQAANIDVQAKQEGIEKRRVLPIALANR